MAALKYYMREKGIRGIDFFRMSDINMSKVANLTGHEKVSKGRTGWMGGDGAGDDTLSVDELAGLLRKIGQKDPKRKAKSVLAALDKDGDRELDVKELMEAIRVASKLDSKKKNRAALRERLAPIQRGAAPIDRGSGSARWV